MSSRDDVDGGDAPEREMDFDDVGRDLLTERLQTAAKEASEAMHTTAHKVLLGEEITAGDIDRCVRAHVEYKHALKRLTEAVEGFNFEERYGED